MQAMTIINENYDFEEEYEPATDPLILSYLKVMDQIGYQSPAHHQSLLQKMSFWEPNMTEQEFLPTMAFEFIQKLNSNFPNHRLIMSDFDSLPDTIPGINAPVVQTRYKEEMVACSSYLVQPGMFDIFFPTDFDRFQKLYSLVCKNTKSNIHSYSGFLSQYANLEKTRVKSGENPMMEYYENVSFFLSTPNS
jgi:hypothetical protein